MDAYESFVVLAGHVTAIKSAPAGCYLTLCNQDGFFPVLVTPALAQQVGHLLYPAARVRVTGRSRSYYHQRRQANQVVIEAEHIASTEGDELPAAGLLPLLNLTMAYLWQSVGELQLVYLKEG
jgi:hypothetical protein